MLMVARQAGINADWQHLPAPGNFFTFAEQCGSALLIDDLKREGLAELRRRNSAMILIQRDFYEGWEGRWRDCPHNGKPQTPERMFDVLTSGFNNSLDVWINFGNEPARGNAREGRPELENIQELVDDVAWYCKVIELFVKAKIRVVVMNIQVVELTPAKLKFYEPIFDLCNRYPEYVAFGIHEYFTMILPLGIGSGDWSRLLKWGDYPRDPKLWENKAQMIANYQNAHIGKDIWLRDQTRMKYPNMRLFKTEMGFDRINNIPQIAALDNANGGRRVRGLDTIIALLHRYFGDDGQIVAGDMVTWMCKNDDESEANLFYNWSMQSEWLDYSCAPYGGFQKVLTDYNHKVRVGELPTNPSTPTVPVPPVVKRTAKQIAADMQKLVNELNAI